MMKTTKLRDAIALALCAASLTANGLAFAQDQAAQQPSLTPPANQQTPTEIDTIVVTGTRIQSQTVTASSPVTEIQSEEFQFTGATRVEDLVNQYPQMAPTFDSSQNNPSQGYPTVDLRGLGSQRTLTLINGFRLPPGAAFNEFRDISILPSSIIRRVDLLTGGASAVYGSDAVAGVVNFILDDEFEGVSISTGYSAYQHSNDNDYMQGLQDEAGYPYEDGNSGFDGASRNIDFAIGSSFADGAGHALAWATYRENDPLFQAQRDYSSCALTDDGTACGGSATNAFGNFIAVQVPDAGAPFVSSASLNPDGSFSPAFGTPYNFAPVNYYQRPDKRYTFGTSLEYEINEHFRPYLEAMFVNNENSTQSAPSGTFSTILAFDCADPIIGSFCEDIGADPSLPVDITFLRRNVEGGPRLAASETSQYRIVAGVEGDLGEGNWTYNASWLYGRVISDTQGFNDLLFSRIEDAIRGCPEGSFDGCLPYLVFEPGGVTTEAAAALSAPSFTEIRTDLLAVNAFVTGDLGVSLPWADDDPIKLAFGVEHREESYELNADINSQTGDFAGSGGPTTPISGRTQVSEIFLESAVPIVQDAGFLEALTLDLGFRHSDYKLSGGANTSKFGLTADFGDYRLRGGYNRAIRAANINELFFTQQIALFSGADPCAGPTPDFTPEQCLNTGVPLDRYGTVIDSPASQYNQFVGGNPELTPEIADTYTFGLVATPIENLQFNIDYFDIKIEDTISTIGANTILTFCGQTGDPFLCDRIRRNPATLDLWIGSNPDTSGLVVNLNGNFGEQHFRGFDVGGLYRWDMLNGRFSAGFQGTYYLEQEIAPLPGVLDEATYDCAGVINTSCAPTPEWRHIANVRYSLDPFTVNLRWRYFGAVDYVGNDGEPLELDEILAEDGGIDAQNYIDLSGSVFVGEHTELTLGVNNVFDREPPLVGGSLMLNANSVGTYDQLGRFIFASLDIKF